MTEVPPGGALAMQAQKLQISKKMVGRDVEVGTLRQIYFDLTNTEETCQPPAPSHEQIKKCRSVYCRGVSGVGKTELVVHALKELVEEDGGYFCRGKFDLIRSHRPFSALMDACNQLCASVYCRKRNSLQALNDIRQSISEQIDSESLVAFMTLLPNLSKLMMAGDGTRSTSKTAMPQMDTDASWGDSTNGTVLNTPQASERGSIQLVNRFEKLKSNVKTLINTLVLPEESVVFFIDDLQWASTDSLEIIDCLCDSKCRTSSRFLFVGGFRSQEVTEDHPVAIHLEEHPNHIILTLGGLSLENISEFVAESIQRSPKELKELVDFIFEKTSGNIFYVKEYLGFLYRGGHLYFNLQHFQWEWEDTCAIQDSEGVAVDMTNVVCNKVLGMPADTIDALKLASCLGSRFDLDVMENLSHEWRKDIPEEEVKLMEEILWHAVEEGLLEEHVSDPFSQKVSYKFVHDKVQSAAYFLIGKATRSYHLKIGRFLHKIFLSDPTSSERAWMLVVAAFHLYKGQELVANQDDRADMAMVCFQAAKELKANAAFPSATQLCRSAIDLLGEPLSAWDRHYDLALSIYNLSALMEFSTGNGNRCEEHVNVILKRANTFRDKQQAYHIHLENLAALRKHEQAVNVGILVLREMNMGYIPRKASKVHVLMEVLLTMKVLTKFNEDDLVDYKESVDEDVEFYGNIIVSTVTACYFTSRLDDFAFLTLRAARVAFREGFSSVTSLLFVGTGMVCGAIGRHDENRRLGRVALRLVKRFADAPVNTFTLFLYYVTAYHYDNQVVDVAKQVSSLHKVALSHGGSSIGAASMYAGIAVCFGYWEGSVRLDKQVAISKQCCEELVDLKKEAFLPITRMYRQIALNLLGRSTRPYILQGYEIKDVDSFYSEIDYTSRRIFHCLSAHACAIFGEWKAGRRHALKSAKSQHEDQPKYNVYVHQFYRTLIFIGLYERNRSCAMKRRIMREIRSMRWRVSKGYKNVEFFLLILQADVDARVYKKPLRDVKQAYDKAISVVTECGYIHYAAVANERAGDFFTLKSDAAAARPYLIAALKCFHQWKAIGKVKHIEQRYDVRLSASDLEGGEESTVSFHWSSNNAR